MTGNALLAGTPELRVLIIDDNPDDRLLAIRTLSREYRVAAQEVSNAGQLAETLAENAFDVAITDYALRWTDGIQVLKAIKAAKPDCPVIMFTGTGNQEVAVEAMKQGLDEYIVKSPKHYSRLPVAVRNALARVLTREQIVSLDAAGVGTWYWDLHENAVTLSRYCAELLELGSDARTVDLSTFSSRFHPDDLGTVVGTMAEAANKNSAFEIECRVQRAEKPDRWVMLNGRAAPDSRGATHRIHGMARDVTERRTAELQRQEALERLRMRTAEFHALFEHAPIGLDLHDKERRYVRVNEELASIHGAGASEHVGRSSAEITPEHAPLFDFMMAEVLTTGKMIEREVSGESAAEPGVKKHWLVGHFPVLGGNGEVVAVGSYMRDITARKQAEEALRESEERFRTLADSVAQMVWIANPDGRILWYNRRWQDCIGSNPREVQNWGWERLQHPEHVGRVMGGIRHAREHSEPWTDTFPLRVKDGEWRWFLVQARPVHDEQGKVTRWFGTHTDVTEQLRTEAWLRRSNEALRQFAYAAAHDLREPLRNIANAVELLRRRYAGGLAPGAEPLLKTAVEGAQRMHQMVNDLLTYSSVADGDEEALDAVEPLPALEEAVGNLRAAIEETDAEITHDPLPPIRIDYTSLVRLFHNLLANAIQYRKPGETPKIHVSVKERETEWVFSVADNGIGFEQAYAKQIFGLFKRLHPRSEYKGTGIGLAVCARIVEHYGGRIWAESKPGEGSRFFFALPKPAARQDGD